MRFRLLNRLICRAGLAGLLCLASVWASRAGDQSEAPAVFKSSQNAGPGASADAGLPPEARRFESRLPANQHHLLQDGQSLARELPAPPPRPPPMPGKFTQQQQDEMDRRANWVFMTPEEMMFGTEVGRVFGTKKSNRDTGGAGEEIGQPTSAMERYYNRLFEMDRPETTNGLASDSHDHGTGIPSRRRMSGRKTTRRFLTAHSTVLRPTGFLNRNARRVSWISSP